MDAKPAWLPGLEKQAAHSEEAWLLGQPPLQRYLDYMQDTVIGGAQMSRTALVDEWRAANDYWYELEKSEAGIADKVDIRDLDCGLKPHVDEVMASSRYRRGFNELPTRFAMVELEKLIVSQRHVDIHHTERLSARLAADRSLEKLFWFCMPVRGEETPVDMRRLGFEALPALVEVVRLPLSRGDDSQPRADIRLRSIRAGRCGDWRYAGLWLKSPECDPVG